MKFIKGNERGGEKAGELAHYGGKETESKTIVGRATKKGLIEQKERSIRISILFSLRCMVTSLSFLLQNLP